MWASLALGQAKCLSSWELRSMKTGLALGWARSLGLWEPAGTGVGLVLGSMVKLGVHFTLLPPQEGDYLLLGCVGLQG